GAVDDPGAGQGQVFDVAAEGEARRGQDGVVAFVGILGDLVTRVIDDIDIVALAADETVGAAAAVEMVVAVAAGQRVDPAIADDDIGHRVAGTVEVSGPEQRDVLDVGESELADVERECGLDAVLALIGKLGQDLNTTAQLIDVVAEAAGHL